MMLSESSPFIQESTSTSPTNMEEQRSQPATEVTFLPAPVISGQSSANHGLTYQPIAIGESPCTHSYYNLNWEIPPNHLSLSKKIGGGAFGQVWKAKVYDVTGMGEQSVVAVKMLRGKLNCFTCSNCTLSLEPGRCTKERLWVRVQIGDIISIFLLLST